MAFENSLREVSAAMVAGASSANMSMGNLSLMTFSCDLLLGLLKGEHYTPSQDPPALMTPDPGQCRREPAGRACAQTCPLPQSKPMIEFYPQIKLVHVAAVMLSGVLFALRGSAQLLGARWTMAAPLRYLSYAIDTTLLTAALMLATVLHQYPFVHAWLTVKVLLLVVYVVLGSFAVKRASTRTARLYFFLAALATYLFIASVARAHNPLGFISWLM
jgi:uncharacterized membrane protein SirB2